MLRSLNAVIVQEAEHEDENLMTINELVFRTGARNARLLVSVAWSAKARSKIIENQTIRRRQDARTMTAGYQFYTVKKGKGINA